MELIQISMWSFMRLLLKNKTKKISEENFSLGVIPPAQHQEKSRS